MRGEVQGDRVASCIGKLLLDLRCVAVAGNAVCLDIFINLAVEVVHFRPSSCSGSSGFCIDDDGVAINEIFL